MAVWAASLFLFWPALDATAAAVPEAEQVVMGTVDSLLPILREDEEQLRNDQQRLDNILRTHIVPKFDMPTISRWVLGKYWRSASELQRAEFESLFVSMLIRTYGDQLLQYTESTITVTGSRMAGKAGYSTVDLVVAEGKLAAPKQARYRMRMVDNNWLIIDVAVDGVSVLVNFRSSIGDVIRHEGMEVLLQRLRDNQEVGRETL